MGMDGLKKLPAARTRLLHIDGPPPFLRFVEKYCESKGMAVDSTDSESLGFHYALVKKYKAILIGAHVPRVDPFRLLRGLARAKIQTPVFLLSESPAKDAKRMGQYPNLLGVIGKPLDLKEFARHIEYADKPPQLEPGDKERILQVLARWERGVKVAG